MARAIPLQRWITAVENEVGVSAADRSSVHNSPSNGLRGAQGKCGERAYVLNQYGQALFVSTAFIDLSPCLKCLNVTPEVIDRVEQLP
jgi:hypothetical protein